MNHLPKRLWHEEDGQDLVEYALFLLLLSFFCVASINSIASSISTMFSSAAVSLTTSAS